MKTYSTPNTEYIYIGAMRDLMGFDDESGGGIVENPPVVNPEQGLAPKRVLF